MAELKTWFRRCGGCGTDILVTDPAIKHGEPMCETCTTALDSIPDEVCECGKNHRDEALEIIAENRESMAKETSVLDMDALWASVAQQVDPGDLEY